MQPQLAAQHQAGTYGWAAIYDDLSRTNNAIHDAVPDAPIAYFRAPGGAWTNDYVAVAHALGMTGLNWDVDPWDWNLPVNGTGEAMTNHIVSHVVAASGRARSSSPTTT